MSTDLHRRHSGYRITVWKDLDTGNIQLQRPTGIDPADAAATLRRAAEIIEYNARHTPPPPPDRPAPLPDPVIPTT